MDTSAGRVYLRPACSPTTLGVLYSLIPTDLSQRNNVAPYFIPSRIPAFQHQIDSNFPWIEKQAGDIKNTPHKNNLQVCTYQKEKSYKKQKVFYRKTQKSKQSQTFCGLIIQREL